VRSTRRERTNTSLPFRLPGRMSHLDGVPGETEVRLRGKRTVVPVLTFEGRRIIAVGKWLRTALIHDEIWMEEEPVTEPEKLVTVLQDNRFAADVFTFGQKFPETTPKFPYYMEWDNVAAIPLSDYQTWWEKRVPQETRKNTRKSAKQGIAMRLATPDDAFIRGVTAIYNETPVRQGKPFSKYGMDFAAVKAEVLQLAERSDFIGAYFQDELVGFIKLVSLGRVASILSIVSMVKYVEKKPTNALIARTVELACAKGMTHLLYGKYIYGNKASSPLTEFKRRNGFEQVMVPRYYIPLTRKGALLIKLKLHRGIIGLLPDPVVDRLLQLRTWFFRWAQRFRRTRTAAA